MTNKEKQLLLKELCARFPYGVKVRCILDFRNDLEVLESKDLIEFTPKSFSFDKEGIVRYLEDNDEFGKDIQYAIQDALDMEEITIDNITPYLRPMTSMTEEERKKWASFINYTLDKEKGEMLVSVFVDDVSEYTDWLDKNMFDYRGLIPMGLALEAPKDMYKIV